MNKARKFLKFLGYHYSHGQWRIYVSGSFGLTAKEQEFNNMGGRPLGKTAGDAVFALATSDFANDHSVAAAAFLRKAGVTHYCKSPHLPIATPVQADKIGFSDFVNASNDEGSPLPY